MQQTDTQSRSGFRTDLLVSRRNIIIALSVTSAALAVYLMPLSLDFSNYQVQVENASGANDLADVLASAESVEVVFPVLFYITASLFPVAFATGCLGIYVKLRYFDKLGAAGWIATSLYFGRFYLLQDVTQIRASFAIALLLAGYLFLRKSRYISASLAFLLAPATHVSSIIFIPIILFVAINRNPVLILRYAFIALIGVLILRLTVPFQAAEWALDMSFPDNSRLLAYLLDMQELDVPSLGGDKLLYVRLLAIGVIAFTTQMPKDAKYRGLWSDWEVRSGLIVAYALMLFMIFHDKFIIAIRLFELSVPFECAMTAAFILLISKPFDRLVGAGGTKLLQLVLTVILIFPYIRPQLSLLN